jgi:hypothetical protein
MGGKIFCERCTKPIVDPRSNQKLCGLGKGRNAISRMEHPRRPSDKLIDRRYDRSLWLVCSFGLITCLPSDRL